MQIIGFGIGLVVVALVVATIIITVVGIVFIRYQKRCIRAAERAAIEPQN